MKNRFIRAARLKQPLITRHFMNVIQRGRLSHAYLFNGESGSGKLAVALTVTMRLFCLRIHGGWPCGVCNECSRITKGEHPDVFVIDPEGQRIKIHQIRFLKTEFAKSAVEGNLKVFIVNQADRMTANAANSLLKFIEEPAGHQVCFLLTRDKTLILPTVVSRTQVVNFPSLSSRVFDRELAASHLAPDQYRLLATMTNNVATARRWCQDHWFGRLQLVVGRWFQDLVRGDMFAFPLVQIKLMPLVNDVGQKTVALDMLIQIWRDVMHYKFEGVKKSEVTFPRVYHEIKAAAERISVDDLLNIIDLMLRNRVLLARNVSFQNLVEAVTLKTLIRLRP